MMKALKRGDRAHFERILSHTGTLDVDSIDLSFWSNQHFLDEIDINWSIRYQYSSFPFKIIQCAKKNANVRAWLQKRPHILNILDAPLLAGILAQYKHYDSYFVAPGDIELIEIFIYARYTLKQDNRPVYHICNLFLNECAKQSDFTRIKRIFAKLYPIYAYFCKFETIGKERPFLRFTGMDQVSDFRLQVVMKAGKHLVANDIAQLLTAMPPLQLPALLLIEMLIAVLEPLSNCVPYFWFGKIAQQKPQIRQG